MWTRNYYNLITAVLGAYGTGNTTVEDYTTPAPIIKGLSGQLIAIRNFVSNTLVMSSTNVNTSEIATLSPFYFNKTTFGYGRGGSGAVPTIAAFSNASGQASFDDYTTNGTYVNLTVSAQSWTTGVYDETNHTYTYTHKITLTNSSTDTVTFNEVGVYLSFNTDTYVSQSALCYHDILDEAITLDASESVVVSITSTVPVFNYQPYTAI